MVYAICIYIARLNTEYRYLRHVYIDRRASVTFNKFLRSNFR